MVQVACIARTPEFVQLIEDLIVILLGTSRNFRWSAHRRSIVLGPYRSRARYLRNRTMLPETRPGGSEAIPISRWLC